MATRIGVDIGGTFTDLIFFDEESGISAAAKAPTTPAAPEEGVAGLVVGEVPDEVVAAAEFFMHGSTVALNALLERRGAVVGLLATRGFRDVLELARGERGEMLNLLWRPQQPLVPRWLRLPVTERILADGTVETPLEVEDVQAAFETFARDGVESIAVTLLNAYANPEHELAVEQALRDCGFQGEISLSHRVSGEYREFERTSTTVVDAYVRPRVAHYLKRLEGRLGEAGFDGRCLITRSGGGAMTFEDARARPFEMIMSGPVAGAVGTGVLCRELGIDLAITADVGGTSFDTCLIVDGEPQLKFQGEVDGMPLQCPWVDVRSIGAGGGSIAYVDAGLLRAGPESAGAVPGPACYGRGGTKPTATDAACLLGMLGFGELAGGVTLDRDRARRAFEPVADELGLPSEEVAQGVLTILGAAMADAIRSVSIEQGADAREASLVAFGGAGPLFATLLARELDIRNVVVPTYAGNFSAWGLLCQDAVRSAALTTIRPVDAAGLDHAGRVLEDLFGSLQDGAENGRPSGEQRLEALLDLRYIGQEHTLTLPVTLAGDRVAEEAAAVVAAFREQYERTFGHVMDEAIEMVAVRANLRTPLPRPVARSSAPHRRLREGQTQAYSFTERQWVDFAVVDRAGLGGDEAAGPLIVVEQTATTYVDAGFSVRAHDSGALLIHDGSGR